MASRKELKELLDEAERQGWQIEHGRGGQSGVGPWPAPNR